jgi:hypothetical protein
VPVERHRRGRRRLGCRRSDPPLLGDHHHRCVDVAVVIYGITDASTTFRPSTPCTPIICGSVTDIESIPILAVHEGCSAVSESCATQSRICSSAIRLAQSPRRKVQDCLFLIPANRPPTSTNYTRRLNIWRFRSSSRRWRVAAAAICFALPVRRVTGGHRSRRT